MSSDQSWGVITINNGEINATGGNTGNGGAGIGGGNHVDSGLIIINGGVVTAEGSAGIGCSIGSSKSKDEADKGPGHYFATVEINGGEVYAYGRDIGAGIGGAMYCDAVVHITGGTIEALIELFEEVGAKVVGVITLIELTDLNGKEAISVPYESLIKYPH